MALAEFRKLFKLLNFSFLVLLVQVTLLVSLVCLVFLKQETKLCNVLVFQDKRLDNQIQVFEGLSVDIIRFTDSLMAVGSKTAGRVSLITRGFQLVKEMQNISGMTDLRF